MQISETVQVTTELVALLEKIDNMSFDRLSIPQENLDLANKFRTSLFPWRGQFSPELVELLLNTYGKDSCTVHDPFVGSGTTLFEASRKGFRCYASEINPSAVEMAKTAHFVNLTLSERKHFIQQAVAIAENVVRPLLWDLFSYQENDPTLHQDEENWLAMAFTADLQKVTRHPYVHNLLVNAFIRYMSYPPPRKDTDLLRAVQEHANIIKSLPYTTSETKVFHADARAIPLPASSIDLIITSPPYINVFNYHQNNRSAMELLGWNLLNIAKSEIGSNRKHRQNRFLTVIQYIYDMVDVFHEMKRLLHPEGKAIIIVGRESNVRGMPFKNGLIVAASALGSGNFQLEMRQERKFKNKFGEIIYEDILHLLPVSQPRRTHENFPESLALWSLMEASKRADVQTADEIAEAIERMSNVQRSPLFQPVTPHQQFATVLKEEHAHYEIKDEKMRAYPTPHLEKLKATLASEKLPPEDKPQVEKAIEHYEQWIANLEITMEADLSSDERLKRMVSLLNEYRIRMDIDLIFDSQHDWLYRQKGRSNWIIVSSKNFYLALFILHLFQRFQRKGLQSAQLRHFLPYGLTRT